MPDYVTIDEMKGFMAGSVFSETQLRSKTASAYHKDTFLSHSSKDNDLVPPAILVLENNGASVYVDLGDKRFEVDPKRWTVLGLG
jgi:hypothetical protein